MNFSPHMPSLYISESFWISSVWFFLLSLNVCLCSYDFGLHFRINWVSKKPCMEKVLCRLGSIPIIMSTNHVKFVVFLPVVKLAFFFCDIFSTVYIWCILYTHLALNVGDTFVMSRLHDVCAKNSCRSSQDLPFLQWFG